MNDVRKEELIRLSMQRELTAEEEASLERWLAAHPVARTQWEEERALSRAIHSLPDVPVSSNFSSRVLQALDLEQSGDERRAEGKNWFRSFLPRLSWVTVALLTLFVLLEHRA